MCFSHFLLSAHTVIQVKQRGGKTQAIVSAWEAVGGFMEEVSISKGRKRRQEEEEGPS